MTLARTAVTMARGTAAKVTWETKVTRATKVMKGWLKKVLARVLYCVCGLLKKVRDPGQVCGSPQS